MSGCRTPHPKSPTDRPDTHRWLDRPSRNHLIGVALTTLLAGLVALLALLVVADVSLAPAPPHQSVALAAKPIRPSGWITIGSLQADAAHLAIAQSLRAPKNEVDIDQVVLNVTAVSGSVDARLIVEMYQTRAREPNAAGLLLSRGTARLADLKPGLVHIRFGSPVHTAPGPHWYAFMVRTSEPGSAATVALLPGAFDQPDLWSSSTVAPFPVGPSLSREWAPMAGSRLLLLLNTLPND
jgi:hypothetical protein